MSASKANSIPTPPAGTASLSAILHVDSQYLSPAAMSAFVALSEKKVAVTLATVDLTSGAQKARGYLDLSLTGRVPTLVLDGFTLSESSAIAEYLDETVSGPPLYPTDPRQRARARQLQAWLRSDLRPLRQERPSDTIFRFSHPPPLSDQARLAAAKLIEVAKRLLPAGATQLFDRWTIADFDLALMLTRLTRNGDPVPAPVARFGETQMARPSFAAWPAW